MLEVTDVKKDVFDVVTEVVCKCVEVDKAPARPKAFIHWVGDPQEVEIRLYSSL